MMFYVIRQKDVDDGESTVYDIIGDELGYTDEMVENRVAALNEELKGYFEYSWERVD